MSEELLNHYKADERETSFLLFEQFKIQEYLGSAPYEDYSEEDARMIISEALKFAVKEVGPLNTYGDRMKCKHDPATNKVTVPPLLKDLHWKFVENGWNLMRVSKEYGGQQVPAALGLAASEFFSGANAAWVMYMGLTHGAAHLIEVFGSDELKKTYVQNMYNGKWMGTMCLTEPNAGSEVGNNATRATKNADGTYNITGTKCFISGGDQDITENIVHLALARVEGSADGTAGLSLFVIPKFRVNADGTPGEFNDVICRGIEKKMGIHASVTATLNFGDNGGCIGHLLGSVENKGMKMMFQMMNEARIGTGMQALAQAGSAYLNAVEYARTRVQGKRFTDIAKGLRVSESVAIIEHEDIKRMLLEMKAKVEGCRALAVKLAVHLDRAHALADDKKAAEKHMGYVELLVPLVKAYLTDQSFRVAELAIQTYGGYGYIGDYPVEQYCRDIKISSLYEGTNYIQSLDLVGRKLNQGGGALVRTFVGDLTEFVKANAEHPVLGAEMKILQTACDAFGATVMKYAGFFTNEKMRPVIAATATRFLEMMSEVTVGWLLLEAAVIAHEKMQGLDPADSEFKFYAGKVASARFFARNILPGAKTKAEIIGSADTTCIDTPGDFFPHTGTD